MLYIAHPDHPPAKLTRTAHDAWTLSTIDFDWVTFRPENVAEQNRDDGNFMVMADLPNNDSRDAIPGSSVTIYSTGGEFTAAMVGSHVKMRIIPAEMHPEFSPGAEKTTIDYWFDDNDLTQGDELHYQGNVYQSVLNPPTATFGNSPPVHLEGTRPDGRRHNYWQFQHSGTGYAKITTFTDAYKVTATISKHLPSKCASLFGTVQSATNANPVVVTHNGHLINTRDKVFIRGFSQMTEVNNRVFTITALDSNRYSLDDEDGTGYAAETTGGATSMRVYLSGGSINRYTPLAHALPHPPGMQTWLWALSAWTPANGYPRAVCFFEDLSLIHI